MLITVFAILAVLVIFSYGKYESRFTKIEARIVKIESDIVEIKSDQKEMKVELHALGNRMGRLEAQMEIIIDLLRTKTLS